MDLKQLLEKLVSIKSVFPEEQELSSFVLNYLKERNFQTEIVPSPNGRNNIVAWASEHNNYIGLYGHMDTVPPASDYVRDPFCLEWDGDIARGLGSSDMKGGLACILASAENIYQQKLPVKLIFGVDEENISQGAHDLVESDSLKNVNFLIAAESGNCTGDDQKLNVVYGRKGRILVQITVSGVTAHAADAHKGVNAVEEAAKVIDLIKNMDLPSHDNFGPTTALIQSIHAEAKSFSVPEECCITCSFLTTPGITGQNCIDQLRELTSKARLNVKVDFVSRATPYCDAFEVPLSNTLLQSIEKEIFEPLGVTPEYQGSVADENVFANRLNIPVIAIGPVGAGAHSKDEWVSYESMERLVEVYSQISELSLNL